MGFPPVLRERRRYIAFELMSKARFTGNQIVQSIKQEVLEFLGEVGYADADFEIVFYDPDSKLGIARTTDKMEGRVVTAITLLPAILGKKAGIKVLGVSGTINKAKTKFLSKNLLNREKQIIER